MKNLGILMMAVIAAVLLIPLLILNGIGGGTLNKSSNIPILNQSGKTGGVSDTEKTSEISDDKINEGVKIKVFVDEENKIEEMYLEEYIRGVVAGEMPAEFEMEALKAQAVAARTYAVTRIRQLGGAGCSNHPGADICTESTHCQDWISKEQRLKAWSQEDGPKYWQKITDAVNETKLQILTYDSLPVMYPMYFSTSSGKTENSKEVFSSQYPYLRSVESPNEESAPNFTTRVVFANDKLVSKFSQSEYKINLDKNKLSSLIRILSRTEGGSVKSIKVGTKTLSGVDVRRILNLNSANFSIEFGKNETVFSVRGYGHGVGMSQWGANAMAKEGKKYDEILKHYYQGVEIKMFGDTPSL